MTPDLVIFVTGLVIGAFGAGIAFGGAYAGFVIRMKTHRRHR